MKLNETKLNHALDAAMQEAGLAVERGDEPYGAVILDETGAVIARAGNSENTLCDPTAHAEILALRQAAARRGKKAMTGCTLVGNYRPCPMCMAAILMTGMEDIYIGSSFDGPEALFTRTADKVRNAAFDGVHGGCRDEECTKQVLEGREIRAKDPNYRAGHQNGII